MFPIDIPYRSSKTKRVQNIDYGGGCSYARDERPCVGENGDIQNVDDYSVLEDILEEERHQLTITGYTNSFHVENHVILVFLMGILSVVVRITVDSNKIVPLILRKKV